MQNLDRAASAMLDSARSLLDAVRQGESFVRRTVGGAAGGAALSPTTEPQPRSGLEPQDVAAIADYTGAGFEEINPMLRGQTPLDVDIMIRSAALSRALAKLPNHRGTVVRGRDLATAEVAFYDPGSIVREPGFTSSDTSRPFPGNTIFYIESKTGKDVSEFSTYGAAAGGKEHEVLFDAGTRFLVQFNDIVDGNRVILMEEVVDRG
ncbi:ADP-ribosyltransferase family protein [Microlunatus flavus]|nr:hypothetical protein [Microlunatus flavus]